MKILALALLIFLIFSSQGRIIHQKSGDYELSKEDNETGLKALQKALGRINFILHRPGADYTITREWVQEAEGRNYWLWLRDKHYDHIVASVKLYEDSAGRVKVIRAVKGLELPF